MGKQFIAARVSQGWVTTSFTDTTSPNHPRLVCRKLVRVFAYQAGDPNATAVEFDAQGTPCSVEEKPKALIARHTGLIFATIVVEIAKALKPSARGT